MTAQRWRLTNTATDPAVSPALQTYTHNAPADVRRQLLSSDASALANVAYTPDAADHAAAGDAFHCQFVSADLGADLVYASGSVIKLAVQGLEAHANNNQFLQVFAAIVDSTGTTVHRILRSKVAHSTELTTGLTNNFLSTTQDGADYTTVSGDRLLVELSTSGTPGGGGGVQGHNATLRWGGNGAGGDLPENDTETGTTLNPWIEFDTTTPPSGQTANYGVAVETDTALTFTGETLYTKSDDFNHALTGYDATNGTPAIVSSPVRSGSGALEISAAGASEWVRYNLSAGHRVVTTSFYVRFASLPSGDLRLLKFPVPGYLFWDASAGKLAIDVGGTSSPVSVGPTLSAGTWYLVDVEYDSSADPAVITAKVDGGTEATDSGALTPADVTSVNLGTDDTNTGTAYFEDWEISSAPGAYPIGPHGSLEAFYGVAAETDSALAFDATLGGGGQTANYGVAAETDTALAFTHSKVASYGVAVETDSALSFTADRQHEYGVAVEADSALAFVHEKLASYGIAAETDAALAAVASKLARYGVALETDTALAFTGELGGGDQTEQYGIAVETDTALAFLGEKLAVYGIASETDSALAFTGVVGEQTALYGVALGRESEEIYSDPYLDAGALPFIATLASGSMYGVAVETDIGLVFIASKLATYGVAAETDTSLAFLVEKLVEYGVAVEADTALSFLTSGEQFALYGIAVETDTALAFEATGPLPPQAVLYAIAVELDVALAFEAETAKIYEGFEVGHGPMGQGINRRRKDFATGKGRAVS